MKKEIELLSESNIVIVRRTYGLKENSKYKIKDVRGLIAKARSFSEGNFKNHLDSLPKSFVEKGSKD